MAASTGLPLGRNEYAFAGALVDHPIQLVKVENSDLLVPADAEIVMEGVILPKVREMEGPYGEYTGYYGIPGMRPVVEIRKIPNVRIRFIIQLLRDLLRWGITL